MAIGASGGRVRMMVLKQVAQMTAIGSLAGIAFWDTHSPVIYWWTGTRVDSAAAYMIAYDGNVVPRAARRPPAYHGFRCVRNP